MRKQARRFGFVGALLLAGCHQGQPATPAVSSAPLATLFDKALAREAHEPLAAGPYLDAIDTAVARWDDPWSAPLVAAALDQLIWRRTAELPKTVDHAVAHRSREVFREVTARLLSAHERAERHPILGPLLAFSLHELALRTGAEPEAATFRRQAGCIDRATAVGPLAWPPLSSLDSEAAPSSLGAFPAHVKGVGPFGAELSPAPSYADVCALDFTATGAAGGLRALVVDVLQPRAGWLYLAAGTRSPVRVDIGGETVLRRTSDLTDGTALLFGRAWVEEGRARVVVRLAPGEQDERVTLQLTGEHGEPLATLVPAAGEVATARASRASTIEIVPEPKTAAELVTAVSAELALGLDRRAARRLERQGALPSTVPPHVELLRMRAWRSAEEVTGLTLGNLLRATADRVATACPDCWEARIAHAQSILDRDGSGPGTYGALEALGIKAPSPDLGSTKRSAPELAFLAAVAEGAGALDLAHNAEAALVTIAGGSPLAADVDALLHRRVGDELARAMCAGGVSRSGTSCVMALLEKDDLEGAEVELARLRRLRGDPSLYRKLELGQLLAHGSVDRAARLYEALPPAERDSAVLALLPPEDGKKRLERDLLSLGDAPYGYEPLARMLGVATDPAAVLEREGAALVAKDRAEAFLPGAGTAVLRHVEHYDVSPRGLLHYYTYDLRRVSDTEDVASSAEADEPRVMGRWTSRVLRRRIHKHDGRVLDPDPNARGRQGHTDLSQLEKGDYVEQIALGWALPEEHGHLVVDGPDAMPARTSVREAVIELSRPKAVAMKVWSHALYGTPETVEQGDVVKTTLRLSNASPRRIEDDVPPLEAHVGVSFGTDDYARIGRAVGEYVRAHDEADPFVARFVAEALGMESASLSPLARVDKLTAAVGKAVRIADPRALSDHVAAAARGTGERAREILERGTGSRSFALYRALREAGIESRIAIAETQPWSAAANFPPHLGRFTHPLVSAKVGEATVWLDADVEGPPLPPGHVSPELRGRMALFTDGTQAVVTGTTEEDADAIDIALELDERGLAQGTFRAEIHGRAAQRIAGALETLVGEPRTNLLRSIVLGWVPWADVHDVALSSERGSWKVAVVARIAPSQFAEPEDRKGTSWTLPGIEPFHAVLPRPYASTLASRYTAQADRMSTLAVDTPLYYRVHRRVTLPGSARLRRTAPALAVDTIEGGQVSARRKAVEQGGVLDETFELNLPVHVVEPAEFDAFVTRVRRVDDGFAHSTRLQLAP